MTDFYCDVKGGVGLSSPMDVMGRGDALSEARNALTGCARSVIRLPSSEAVPFRASRLAFLVGWRGDSTSTAEMSSAVAQTLQRGEIMSETRVRRST